MSEPVGNSPRGPIIPGNSHKDREIEARKEPEPREKVEKIVEGKVVTRKQPWWKRAVRSMIADDAQSIGDFIMGEVIQPAVKNLIRDIVVGGTDRTLYGTSRVRRRGIGIGGGRESLTTRYDRMSEGSEPRRMSQQARARHDFDEVVLGSREEAVDVVENMLARIERYGSASVSDLYDYVGVTGSYADQKWGWYDLRDADVRQVRGGFLLDLPRPEPLR